MNNETTGRGGARANSGAKSSGIETVTVRIDKRLLNLVTTIKDRLKGGASIDDVHFGAPKPSFDDLVGQDAKLLKKISKLERENNSIRDGFFELLHSDRKNHKAEIDKLNDLHQVEVKKLKQQISILNSALSLSQAASSESNAPEGLDGKLIRRLKQFCHPDKHKQRDEKTIAIANDLMKQLNGINR